MALPLAEHQTTENCPPPLCLTASFDTTKTHDLSCGSSAGSDCDGDEIDNSVQNYRFKSENGDTIVTDAPGGFEIECLQDKRRLPTRNSNVTRFHNSSCNENIEMVASSFILTREQVFEKLEITKKKQDSTDHVGRHNICDAEHSHEQEGHLQECSICMEVFKVGDKVSFSPAEGCLHVFHHDCLRRWLLRKTDCPCCRVIVLPVDRPNPKVEEGCDEETGASQTISNTSRAGNFQAARRQLFRPRPSKDTRPWYHKNPTVIHERLNKKCGTFCCVACGVVVLKKDLREDLSTKTRSATKGRI